MSYYYYQRTLKYNLKQLILHIYMVSKVNTTSSIALFNYAKLQSIEDALSNHFIPIITGESSISEHLRQLIALPIQLGGWQ